MGERGPLPRPANEVRALGNPGHKQLRETLKAPPTAPAEPRWAALLPGKDAAARRLRAEAAACWRRSVPDLDRLGILSPLDLDVLVRYCTTEALWRDALRHLVADGPTVSDGREGTRANPSARMVRQYAADLLAMGRLLGLAPAARLRMELAPRDEADDWVSPWDV